MSDDLAAFEAFRARWAGRKGHKAQLDQDLWVLYETQEKRGGYFVEFGACNGFDLSNTLLLEQKYDWAGIVAEPNPVWHRDLLLSRHCAIDLRCVWTETGKTLEFWDTPNPELAGIEETIAKDNNSKARDGHLKIQVPTVSMADLLRHHKAPRRIDLLSIDTEGSEVQILRAFPWADWDIRLIAVEHNHTPAREELHALLTGVGFSRKFESISKWDSWYCKAD